MNFQTNSRQQLKIMTQVLCKMSKFFNQMTELCLLQLTDNQSIQFKHRVNLNKENLRNLENIKRLQQLKQKDQVIRNQQKINKIKGLKPKHPISSFFFFYRDKGQQIAKERGQVIGSKKAKIVSQVWKNMTEAQRHPYQIKARQTRQKYQQQMINYNEKYGVEIAEIKKRKKLLKQSKAKDKEQQQQLLIQQAKSERKDFQQKNSIDRQIDLSSEDESLLAVSEDMTDSLSENAKSQAEQQSNEHQAKISQTPIKIDNAQLQDSVGQLQQIDELLQYEESNPANPIPILPKVQSNMKQFAYTPTVNNLTHSAINQCQKSGKEGIVRPKGPISSFFLFYRDEGKRISEQNDLPLGPETIKLASSIWKKMSGSQKQKYKEQSLRTRSIYQRQIKQLKQKYGSNIFQRKRDKTSSKGKKKGRKSQSQKK